MIKFICPPGLSDASKTVTECPCSEQTLAASRPAGPAPTTIIFFKPRVLTLFTDRNSVLYNKIDDFKIREWYVVNKNSLLILDQNRKNLFNKFPAKLVYENNQFIVYKFN